MPELTDSIGVEWKLSNGELSARNVQPAGSYTRAAAITSPQAQEWIDVVHDSTEFEQSVSRDAAEITLSASGLYVVAYNVRAQFAGSSTATRTVASRVVVSTDGGQTFAEAVDLKAISSRDRFDDEIAQLAATHPVLVNKVSIIKLQVYSSHSDVSFEGSPLFDTQQAAHLSVWRVSYGDAL